MDDDPENARFFINGADGKYLFDLPGYGLNGCAMRGWARPNGPGIAPISDAGRFYSYRRSVHRKEADYGRLISAIRL
jgi:copper oxidase (laccase) domain-containing protein